jgi:anti-sigma factor RsiW
MDCRHAQHLLDSYLDGKLPASLRAEIHAHRLTCPRCQRAMAIVEVAADVIATDRPEPDLSLNFTNRVMTAMRPQVPQTARRVIRFRRVAAVLGPVSAAAVWMIIASAIRPIEHVPNPRDILSTNTGIAVLPRTAAVVVEASTSGTPSATIADSLAEGLLTPAMTAWRDTQRSTRDLFALGQLAIRAAGQTLGGTTAQDGEEGSAGGRFEAGSIFRNLLTPKPEGETGGESPDVL